MNLIAMALLRVAAVMAGVITIVTIAHPGFWLGAGMIAVSFVATVIASLMQRPPKTGYR